MLRTLQRILVLLQSNGLLSTQPRFRDDGARTSNKYKLALDTPHDKLSGGDVMDDRGPPTSVSPPPDTGVVVTTTEPPSEPSQPPPPTPEQQRDAAAVCRGGGDLIYPKGLTSTQRQALRGQLASLTPALAQQVVDELAGRMAIATIRNPIRYCSTLVGRLLRGKFTPELGLAIADERKAADARMAALAQSKQAALVQANLNTTPLPHDLREAVARLRARSAARHAGVNGEIPGETNGKKREDG